MTNTFNNSKIFQEWINEVINNLINLVNTIKNNDFIDNSLVSHILDTVELISKFIKSEHIFYEEFYDFKSVQRLIKLSLENKNIDELNIVLGIIYEFKKLSDFKFSLLDKAYSSYPCSNFKDLSNEFLLEYNNFKEFLFDSELESYTLNNKIPVNDTLQYSELLRANLE